MIGANGKPVSYDVARMASEKVIVRASNPGQFESDNDPPWARDPNSDTVYHIGKYFSFFNELTFFKSIMAFINFWQIEIFHKHVLFSNLSSIETTFCKVFSLLPKTTKMFKQFG